MLNSFATEEDVDTYVNTNENYSSIFFKGAREPDDAWAVPFVTGHRYKIHWSDTGLDFTRMRIDLSRRWEETDLDVGLVFNHTDVREAIYFTLPDSTLGEVEGEPHVIKESTLPEGYQICSQAS